MGLAGAHLEIKSWSHNSSRTMGAADASMTGSQLSRIHDQTEARARTNRAFVSEIEVAKVSVSACFGAGDFQVFLTVIREAKVSLRCICCDKNWINVQAFDDSGHVGSRTFPMAIDGIRLK